MNSSADTNPKKSSILNHIHQAGDSDTGSKPDPQPTQSTEVTPETPKANKRFSLKLPKFKLPSFKKRYLLGIPGVFLLIIGLLAALTLPPLLQIKRLVPETEASARQAYDSLKNQDLVAGKQHLTDTRTKIDQINSQYKKLAWAKFTPARAYYLDGDRVLTAAIASGNAADTLLSAVEPYADVLGFSGQGSFAGGTAEERIVKIIETLDKVTPSLDQIAADLTIVNEQLAAIDPQRYPFEVRGQQASELITTAQDFSTAAVVAVTDVKPLLEVIPSVAGIDSEKKYLVLFQNDAELRPTGGFLTAYGTLRVEKGRTYQEKNDDIYQLDNKFNSRLKPPAPIEKYLDNVFYWHLRDMNLSPDYKVSMDTFLEHYLGLPDEPETIDGVIAVDTQVLSDLVSVLGPLEVPGFGEFSSEIDPRCDCPQVIYELEDFATRPVAYVRTDRKAFLTPMMQALIIKAYGSPRQVWPQLFQVVIENVRQKHVLFYMMDQEAQAAAEQVGIAGRISQDVEGDYFHLNEANFGGAKSNMFITHSVQDEIEITDAGVVHNMTLTYKNPAPWSDCNLESGGLCLNGQYRGFMRFLVPQGTQLDESLGFQADSVQTYEELGKTVIEGFFEFVPESQTKLKLTYTVPINPEGQYNLFIQKQPGQKEPEYTLTVNGTAQQQFNLKYDKQVTFEL